MLNVSHLSFARGNKLVLKDINLSVTNSEVLLIKGSNGIGKSTFLSCIAGFLEPLEGTVEYFSKSIDPTISAKNFIFVGEENFAYEDLSILDNIYYWLCLNCVTPNQKSIHRSIEYLFGRIDVDKKFHRLSYGQKRKMRMLLLLLIDKPVWILDDPFNGLDDETISKLIKIISMKRDQHGMIIMATHIIPHIRDMKEFELS
ncbi:ATP-binding cassette domain-containing protein [Alphaproteobacteria bacterium]|jgi:ABC-type transport system involved in cytochrome c biogenesis ATPase subunit|nr:ATP-binding cassette domain-containing protein [Alphaproteobacteria bacterium]